MNRTLRVAALYFENYYNLCIFTNPDNCTKPGINVEVFRDLARMMNFSIEWIEVDVFGSGDPRENGSVFAALEQGRADITGIPEY